MEPKLVPIGLENIKELLDMLSSLQSILMTGLSETNNRELANINQLKSPLKDHREAYESRYTSGHDQRASA
jgi:hypothetical protein